MTLAARKIFSAYLRTMSINKSLTPFWQIVLKSLMPKYGPPEHDHDISSPYSVPNVCVAMVTLKSKGRI